MEKINNGGPAFPIPGGGVICTGISIRDYFAAKAMGAICSHVDTWGFASAGSIAEESYRIADAMLKAREV